MQYCFGLFTYTPSINMDRENWNQFALKDNIIAVPYCDNESQLQRLKGIVAVSLKFNQERHDQPTEFKMKTINLLNTLEEVIGRRLSEIPYIKTASQIVLLFSTFNNSEDRVTWARMLEESTNGLNSATEDLEKLQAQRDNIAQSLVSCSKLFIELNELSIHTEKALGDNFSSLSDSEKTHKYAKPTPWTIEIIKNLKKMIPMMNREMLLTLLKETTEERVKQQTDLANYAEELKWLDRSLDLINANKVSWWNFKTHFEKKIETSISPYVQPAANTTNHSLVDNKLVPLDEKAG